MSRRCLIRWLACVALLPIAGFHVTGCGIGGRRTEVSGAGTGKLVVVAPHVTTRALSPINESFLRDHPGTEIEVRAEMIDEMCDRMEAYGGNGDILVMMDGPEMGIIESAGLTDSSRKRAWGTCPVAIVAPNGNPKKIRSIYDALRPDVTKISIPDPQRDSAGAAFRTAATGAGIWGRIAPKVVISGSPHSACTAVEDGKADIAITYSPCVLFGHSESTLCLAAFLPHEFCKPAVMAAVPFGDSKNPLVDEYLDYLLREQSQAIVGQAGFEPVRPANRGKAKVSLEVPCGAGLQPAMDDLGRIYFQRTGVRVDFSYAGAGMLLSVLMTTRRGDLYIPGEAYYVDQAAKHGFIAEDTSMCYMTPVMGVRKGNPEHVRSIMDLARPDLRVAIGDPEAIAIGPMTERILQRAGILEPVERQVHMKAACVPELANALATHSADVGVIWDVMAFQNRKHLDSVPIDPTYNEASEVLVSRLTCSKQPEEARKLMEFLTSEEAAAVLHRHGYATERPAGVRLAPREKVGGRK